MKWYSMNRMRRFYRTGLAQYINFGNIRFSSRLRRDGRSCITGFTLIELLMVVSIITLIASTLFIQFSAYRARARDVQREQAMKELQKALELYATNKGVFPQGSGVLTGTDPVSLELINADTLPAMPRDPLNTGAYVYAYDSQTGKTYAVTYTLETDSILGKAKGLQTATP